MSLLFPRGAKNLIRLFSRRLFEWVSELPDSSLRKMAAIELVFGLWMLVLWRFGSRS